MSVPFLTVLTTPIQSAPRRAYQALRRAVRPLVKPGVRVPQPSKYPGHFALVRSVVEGLRAMDADFNFDPRSLSHLARVVYAPANEALRQAASLKRLGRIDYLVAGPVNALFLDECDAILQMPEIDLLIVACDWVRDWYAREAPALAPKLRVCPAGVDAERWKPSGRRSPTSAVVYWKSGPESLCEDVEHVVMRCGLEPTRVRARHGEHGHYDPGAYRQILDRASIGVFLSSFETQGLALVEAWSMDVPTMAWDPRGDAEWLGRTFQSGSSCPYLTPATGRAWTTIPELGSALGYAVRDRQAFRPREWVLKNMTDAISSAALLRIIREGAGNRL